MMSEIDDGEAGKTVWETANKVLTIGHSTLSLDGFLAMLEEARVTAIADVRSSPFSRRMPHFSRPELQAVLKAHGIRYVFLGKELGGRPHAGAFYCDGVADYEKMALEPDFCKGIDRVMSGAKQHNVALMCSEHNPLDCHRCLLVGRALAGRGVPLGHILDSGQIVEHHDIEEELLILSNLADDDMFADRQQRLEMAYRQRAMSVAYREARPEMEVSATSS